MYSQFVPTTHLTAGDRQSMIALLDRHFDGVKRDVFEADLTQKNWVLLLRDQHSDELKGFSTLCIYETKFQGKPISVIYSGDTVMDPSAWSSSALARSWISAVKHLRQHYPNGKFYWLLISSGYRTYRFLPIFWRIFYPRYDSPTPPDMNAIMTFLAGKEFGKFYHEAEGIVRFPNPHRLKGMLQGIPEERKIDPHIRFFEQKNPGHLQGDELVCIAEICEQNLTRAGRRMWFETSSRSSHSQPPVDSHKPGVVESASNSRTMISPPREIVV